MKKNTLHKVMATALVGAMAMSTLTGCGSKDTADGKVKVEVEGVDSTKTKSKIDMVAE